MNEHDIKKRVEDASRITNATALIRDKDCAAIVSAMQSLERSACKTQLCAKLIIVEYQVDGADAATNYILTFELIEQTDTFVHSSQQVQTVVASSMRSRPAVLLSCEYEALQHKFVATVQFKGHRPKQAAKISTKAKRSASALHAARPAPAIGKTTRKRASRGLLGKLAGIFAGAAKTDDSATSETESEVDFASSPPPTLKAADAVAFDWYKTKPHLFVFE